MESTRNHWPPQQPLRRRDVALQPAAVSSSKWNGDGVRESAGQGREVTKPSPDFEEPRTPHDCRENTGGASAQAGAWTHCHWQGTGPRQKHGEPGVAARGGRSAVWGGARAGGGGPAWAAAVPTGASASGRDPRGIEQGLESAANRGTVGAAGANGVRATEPREHLWADRGRPESGRHTVADIAARREAAAAGPVRHAARAPSQSDACAGDRGAARGDQ